MDSKLIQLLKDDIERSASSRDLADLSIGPRLEAELTSLCTGTELPDLSDDDVELLEAVLSGVTIPTFIRTQVDAAWRSGRYRMGAFSASTEVSVSGISAGVQFRKNDGKITDEDHLKATEAISKFKEDLRKAGQRKR